LVARSRYWCSHSSRRAHKDPRGDRGEFVLLVVAVASTVIVLVTFAFTTLVDEPGTAVALVVILAVSILADLGWKAVRDRRAATPSDSI
jgi:hypothetical protein